MSPTTSIAPARTQVSHCCWVRRAKQTRIPRLGNMLGVRKCSCSTRSLLSTKTQMLTPMNSGEHRGHHTLVGHTVDDSGGHDSVDEGAVGYGEQGDQRELPGRYSQRTRLHHL